MNVHAAIAPPEVVPGRRRLRTDTQAVRALLYIAQAAIDIVVLLTGMAAADLLRHGRLTDLLDPTSLVVVPALFQIVAFYTRLYSSRTLLSYRVSLHRLTLAVSVTMSLTLLFLFATKDSVSHSRTVFFLGAVMSYGMLAVARIPILWLVRKRLADRVIRRILVLDDCPTTTPPGFEVIDAAALPLHPDGSDPFMLDAFSTLVTGADRVVISCPPERREAWSMYLRGVGCSGELLVPELHAISPVHREEDTGWVGIRVSTGPLDLRNRILKRTLDLTLTVPAIILLSPLLALLAIAIRLDSAGPVLFRQRRMGRGNRLFDVLKFRSMKVDRTDLDGHRSASRDDDRVTRVGRIIRATSMDELPQLFNVLSGDMSLVGPRPHALGSRAGDELFWHVDQRYWLRHAIKPGITGLAQVRGHRGATDRKRDLTDRLQSDLEYVGNWSLWSDVSILARTAAVLTHRNAF